MTSMQSTPPKYSEPTHDVSKEEYNLFHINHDQFDVEIHATTHQIRLNQHQVLTQSICQGFAIFMEQMTGTYLTDDFILGQTVKHQGDFVTELSTPGFYANISFLEGNKFNVVFGNRLYKDIVMVPYTSTAVIDQSRTRESNLGGTITFPVVIGNSQSELKTLVEDHLKRSGTCEIDKFGNFVTVTNDHNVPRGRRLYFEVKFAASHNPETFRLQVNQFSYMKVGSHTIKINWFKSMVKEMKLCDCCFNPLQIATCVRSSFIRHSGTYDVDKNATKSRGGPSRRGDDRAAAARQRTMATRRTFEQFARE